MSLVAYITRKVFAGGIDEIRIKHNPEITVTTIERARKSRAKNKIKREQRQNYLKHKLLTIPLYDPNYLRKRRIIEYELQLRNIQNIVRSARRSRESLYDICRCNDFQYFVTWTFDQDKIDRLNDNKVKRKFTQFQNYLRKKFPQMYYVAVPEYHKKGGLHFHLLVGGVTMDELKAVPAVSKKGRLIFKKGKQIFNVERWKLGFSTLSVIVNREASEHYICKYITKQHYDDRFFGKRRYYVSKNIRRPEIEKYRTTPEKCLDGINLDVYTVSFADTSKKFAVFTSNGNGIVSDRNTEAVKQDIAELTAPAARTVQARAAAPSGACPYSTLRTLDSTSSEKAFWRKKKRVFKQAIFKTKREFKPPHEDYDVQRYEEQTILDEMYANMAVSSCANKISNEEYCREIGLID